MKNVYFNLARIATLSARSCRRASRAPGARLIRLYSIGQRAVFLPRYFKHRQYRSIHGRRHRAHSARLAFRFYGQDYSALCVSANGNMTFGGCPPNDVTNVDCPL